MKKLFFLLSFIMLSFLNVYADGLDADYNFIDTAFDGIKPITQKEFNDTVYRLTPEPIEDSFKGKMKAFLFGRKFNKEAPKSDSQEVNIDIGGEKQAIQDIKNGIYFIRITAPIIGSNGEIIPLGDYKIQEKIRENKNMLIFVQGQKEYGALNLKAYEDDAKKENDIAYSRVDIVNENVLRIVYSTIQDTKCAYARVYTEE